MKQKEIDESRTKSFQISTPSMENPFYFDGSLNICYIIPPFRAYAAHRSTFWCFCSSSSIFRGRFLGMLFSRLFVLFKSRGTNDKSRRVHTKSNEARFYVMTAHVCVLLAASSSVQKKEAFVSSSTHASKADLITFSRFFYQFPTLFSPVTLATLSSHTFFASLFPHRFPPLPSARLKSVSVRTGNIDSRKSTMITFSDSVIKSTERKEKRKKSKIEKEVKNFQIELHTFSILIFPRALWKLIIRNFSSFSSTLLNIRVCCTLLAWRTWKRPEERKIKRNWGWKTIWDSTEEKKTHKSTSSLGWDIFLSQLFSFFSFFAFQRHLLTLFIWMGGSSGVRAKKKYLSDN